MLTYSSVIVTYNRKEKLIDALNSLLQQTVKPRRIVLIDNCSTDGTKDYLKAHDLLDNPLIDYNLMPKNYGGSGGFYMGIKRALEFDDYDFLSLSDDDADYNPDFFDLILKQAENYPDIKAFCGSVCYPDGSLQLDHRRIVTNHKWLREAEVPASQYQNNFYVDMLSFVGSVISRQVLTKIGLPEKDFFIYYDDTEYSLRIREYTKILNVSNAKITHQIIKRSNNNKNMISWKNYYEIRNSMLMKKKHSNWPLLTLYFYYRYIRLLLTLLTSSDYQGVRRKAIFTYSHGFHDALHGVKGKVKPFVPGEKY